MYCWQPASPPFSPYPPHLPPGHLLAQHLLNLFVLHHWVSPQAEDGIFWSVKSSTLNSARSLSEVGLHGYKQQIHQSAVILLLGCQTQL